MDHSLFSGGDASVVAAMVDRDAPEVAPFWRGCADGSLMVQWCGRCRSHRWPPRPFCRLCGGPVEWVEVARAGRLFSWTVVHVSPLPAFTSAVPYVVAIAELPAASNIRFVARLIAPAATPLELGQRLQLDFETAEDVALPVWLLPG